MHVPSTVYREIVLICLSIMQFCLNARIYEVIKAHTNMNLENYTMHKCAALCFITESCKHAYLLLCQQLANNSELLLVIERHRLRLL